jgi:hypothetical protein
MVKQEVSSPVDSDPLAMNGGVEAMSASLPDLSEMFNLDQEDLRLDWPDPEQLTSISLNTEELDFNESWLNKEIFSNIF